MLRITKKDVKTAYKFYELSETTDIKKDKAIYILKTKAAKEVICLDRKDNSWSLIGRESFDDIVQSTDETLHLEEISKSYALWLFDFDDVYNGEGDDAAVEAILEKWKVKKEEYRAEWNGAWPAKQVEIQFYLNGKKYKIKPSDIGLDDSDCWDHDFMEYVEGDIIKDIKKLDVEDLFVSGFLD